MFPSNKKYAIQHIVTENGIGIHDLLLRVTVQNNLWEYYNFSTHAWQGSPSYATMTGMTTGDFGGNGGYYIVVDPQYNPAFFVEGEDYLIRIYHDDPSPLVDFGFYDTCVAPTAEAVSTAAIYNDMAKEASTQAAINDVKIVVDEINTLGAKQATLTATASVADLIRMLLDNDQIHLEVGGYTYLVTYDDAGALLDGEGVPQGVEVRRHRLRAFGNLPMGALTGTVEPSERYRVAD